MIFSQISPAASGWVSKLPALTGALVRGGWLGAFPAAADGTRGPALPTSPQGTRHQAIANCTQCYLPLSKWKQIQIDPGLF